MPFFPVTVFAPCTLLCTFVCTKMYTSVHVSVHTSHIAQQCVLFFSYRKNTDAFCALPKSLDRDTCVFNYTLRVIISYTRVREANFPHPHGVSVTVLRVRLASSSLLATNSSGRSSSSVRDMRTGRSLIFFYFIFFC